MSYTSRMLSSLPFGNIIGGPLKAAIEAQGMAAHATVDFIQTVGFNPKPRLKIPGRPGRWDYNPVAVDATPDMGSVRNVTFSYKSTNDEGEEVNVELTVPLLTIIPIPFLRIEEMTINFTAKITEERNYEYSYERSRTSEEGTEENEHLQNKRNTYSSDASFKGTVTTNNKTNIKSNSRYQTECAMEINVRATQDDMPGGLSKILSILESAILEKRSVTEAEPVPEPDNG
jgi:hypothetical protein